MQSVKISLPAPIDPEVNILERKTLDYLLTFPKDYDPEKQYGLVFCIPGYGDNAESDYQANKLRPYIANTYNVITVGVRYYYDVEVSDEIDINIASICFWYGLSSDYFHNLNGNQILDRLFELLASRSIFSLDPRLAFETTHTLQYHSFGFLPALDHLHVLADIMKKYNIDKTNIIAFGTSYGGYISCLMAKYAPHTFSLVIENSGFCVTQLNKIFGGDFNGTSGSFSKNINGKRYEIPFVNKAFWSHDETSPNYFSDSHKRIRSLLIEEHRIPSQTAYCSYHSPADATAPILLKDKMCNILKKYNLVYYKTIAEKDIDGQLFKNMDHGMNASLRKLFDVSIWQYKKMNTLKNSETDFDINSRHVFNCFEKDYVFSYSSQGLDVTCK
ncbi:DUF2920 family protein [Anaeroarcus burkinensis]|uniref:DUF2920 family protein n=1 Tax=Anaeroarcus burkinensis TaxID=82376 RepID=UPI000424ADBC|nr:DUF2920 family protein [Anaeroarcus burkinensis]